MSGDADGSRDSGSQGSGTQDTGSQDTRSGSGRGGGRESGLGSGSRATDDVLDAVGPRLRALRRRRGITLAELAAETGISESTLSRLESGRRRATLELLLPLARRYDVPLDDLVGAPRTGDPRIHLKPVRRFGMIFVPLSRRPGGIHAFKMIIPARPEPLGPTPQTHEGHEWVYVLSGRLRLVLGDRDLVLPPGEAAEFDTSLPHWLGSADGGAVELLILFGPHGMRAHVRADPTGPDADPDPAGPDHRA